MTKMPSVMSEPTPEGQDEEESVTREDLVRFLIRDRDHYAGLLSEARADLARMKAAMEESHSLLKRSHIEDAFAVIDAALKGTSP